ncbi:acetylornithine deacetylase [Sinorhizobium sp. RAC02]|uniref:acetylornithine deacetylase n=1 Tax=Sinorhizobium sp. RAC02 TaxID=1842534 RepID=UPI00083D179C|nr:acetylornithine deacetylase [Sinorhizobium sp. RAC02]AOF92471.1 acetylornithine deacetylase [Sinorhizobium sp. RAC02]
MKTLHILERLVAFPTLSRRSNRDLIDFVEGLLHGAGIETMLVASVDGTRANLFATIGPRDRGGVVLSGHTDVVPVEGQAWTRDPFRLSIYGDRVYGRGTTDMKGFVAAAIAVALRAAGRDLQTPLHLAFSYDEEIGCVGVRDLLESLADRTPRPMACIVGEPTGMRIATGHKGKLALRACCIGHSAHSALAPTALNALHLGADFLGVLRREQRRLAESGARDAAYDVAISTIHAGRMSGGQALNIVPNRCDIDFEIRNVAADDPAAILARIFDGAEAIVAPLRVGFPESAIAIEEVNAYPGLDTGEDADIVRLLRRVLEDDGPVCKVAFGTEAGLFDSRLGVPSVVCGPGHMDQGHKPDEYIEIEQLAACDSMLDRLVQTLAAGL